MNWKTAESPPADFGRGGKALQAAQVHRGGGNSEAGEHTQFSGESGQGGAGGEQDLL